MDPLKTILKSLGNKKCNKKLPRLPPLDFLTIPSTPHPPIEFGGNFKDPPTTVHLRKAYNIQDNLVKTNTIKNVN